MPASVRAVIGMASPEAVPDVAMSGMEGPA